jgi:hypothetical protein
MAGSDRNAHAAASRRDLLRAGFGYGSKAAFGVIGEEANGKYFAP